MEKNLSSQIYCINLEYPFEIIVKTFNDCKLVIEFFESVTFKIKRFLGSNLNIDGSGYLWQGKNKNTFSVESSSKSSDFGKFYYFKITHINGTLIKEDISIEMNIYKNTHDQSTIIEYCFGYLSNNNCMIWLKNKLLDFGLKDFVQRGCENLNNYLMNSSDFSTITHSFYLNINYKVACKIFRDIANTAKILGVDKSWKVKNEKNFYSVEMENGVSFDLIIYKEEENDDKSISLFYRKYKGDIPFINEWMKVDFLKISKDKCILIHETKIPINIKSRLYNTIYNYILYILSKWKYGVEFQFKTFG